MHGINTVDLYSVLPTQQTFWRVGVHFEILTLTILFKNAKLNKYILKKKQHKFSTILGWSEKGKQTFF